MRIEIQTIIAAGSAIINIIGDSWRLVPAVLEAGKRIRLFFVTEKKIL